VCRRDRKGQGLDLAGVVLIITGAPVKKKNVYGLFIETLMFSCIHVC